MKRNFSIILSASAASLLAFSALAQDPLNPKKDGPSSVSDRLSQARRGDQLNDAAKASDVIGMTVKNLQDEKLGKVENILVDLSSGRVVALVVSSGGFLGMGDELSAVPPAALEFSADRTTLHLDASKSMLSEAPHFKAHQWPDFSQSSYVLGVYRAFRVEPYFIGFGLWRTAPRTILPGSHGSFFPPLPCYPGQLRQAAWPGREKSAHGARGAGRDSAALAGG